MKWFSIGEKYVSLLKPSGISMKLHQDQLRHIPLQYPMCFPITTLFIGWVLIHTSIMFNMLLQRNNILFYFLKDVNM